MKMRDKIRQAMSSEDTSIRDIVDIVEAACLLKKRLYEDKSGLELGDTLFNLRKSLEGIFGHDVPDGDD